MNILIADDDDASRSLLRHFIEPFPEYRVVGEAANCKELFEWVLKEKPDILLMDIRMPDLNGVDAVKACKVIHPPLQIIFITGYDDYAIEAFALSAVDYIVKPIERVRLFIALEKARKSIELEKSLELTKMRKETDKLAIKSRQSYVYIDMDDILFIEKEGRKSIIHTKYDSYDTIESLQDLHERLPDTFFKSHRSYLVNLKKITRIDSSGETYIAHFASIDKKAYISKLKIYEVHRIMGI